MIVKHLTSLAEEAWKQNDTAIMSLLAKTHATRMLDLGCGDGAQSEKWSSVINPDIAVGIELVEEVAVSAVSHGLQVVRADLGLQLPFRDGSFDLIIANQVIEHLRDFDVFMSEIHRVLTTNGSVIISTENMSSWHNILALLMGYRPFSQHYPTKRVQGNPFSPHNEEPVEIVMHGTPHTYVLSIKTFISLVRSHGFEIETLRGVGYYLLPVKILMSALAKLDPTHSHLIVVRLRKQEGSSFT